MIFRRKKDHLLSMIHGDSFVSRDNSTLDPEVRAFLIWHAGTQQHSYDSDGSYESMFTSNGAMGGEG